MTQITVDDIAEKLFSNGVIKVGSKIYTYEDIQNKVDQGEDESDAAYSIAESIVGAVQMRGFI
tara:strand:- start:4843 stop:5031 length:189 start_codon:yes stop_codon:yes gene_type:complete